MGESKEKLIKAIQHYQDSLERHVKTGNSEKLLHAIDKLSRLPIKVCHLEQTGVGRTVNGLKKFEGTVGDNARSLVDKWKTMVKQEEEEEQLRLQEEKQMENETIEEEEDPESLSISVPPEDEDNDSEDSEHIDNSKSSHKKYSSDKRSRSRERREKKSKQSSSDDSESESDHKHKKHNKKSSSYNSDSESTSDSSRNSSQEKKRPKKSESSDSSSEESDSEKDIRRHKSSSSRDGKHKTKHSSVSESDSNSESRRGHNKAKKSGSESDKHSKSKESHASSKSKSDSRDKHRDSSSKSKSKPVETERKTHDKEKPSHSEKSAKTEEKRNKESSKETSSHREKESSKGPHDKKRHREESSNNRDAKRHKSDSSDHRESKSKSQSREKSSKNEEKQEKSKKDNSKTPSTPKKATDSINSGSGTSFADALGMLEPPRYSKSKKKSATEEKHQKPSSSKEFKPSSSKSNDEIGTNGKVPNLLKDPGHLQPLDINISSLLPSITPNYRPLATPLDNHNKKMGMDDETFNKVISAKHQRTKVYSGNKVVYTRIPSLFEICSRVLQDNLDALEYTGGVPYSILKPILEKANPDQLYQLEFHNPYLIEDTDELWQLHCQKEFKNKKRDEMESWRDMYLRCLDEREAKLKALTANIKQSQDKSLPVRQTKLAYVDSVVKPPRNIARKQAKNGTAVEIKRPSQTPTERLSQLAKAGEAGKVSVPNPGKAGAERSSSSYSAPMKPKKAPLMAKTLSLLKNRFGRR